MRLGKKPKTFAQVLIDLTPLLDVIFILLIVVLTFQDDYSAKADAKVSEAEEYVDQANDDIAKKNAELDVVNEQLDNYANMNTYVTAVSIYASYQPSNRKYREIHIQINADEPKLINLNPSNSDEAWNECKDFVEQYISPDTPMIISVKNEKMLYRDEQKITEICNNLTGDNVYMHNERKENDGE